METGNEIDLNGLARLVLKLTGLALAVFGAVMLSGYLTMLPYRADMTQGMAFVIQPAVLLAAGLFLWLFPTPVANTVVRKLPPGGGDAPPWVDRLVEAGAVLIGFWWLLRAISDLVYHVLVIRAQDEMLKHSGGYEDFGPLMIATAVEFVLALVLILGARGIVGLIHRLRYGGLATDRGRAR